MYVLYSILLGLAYLVVIPLYFVRLKVMRGQRLHLRERFGGRLLRRKTDGPLVWIHAVSVGEVLSLQSLVRELKTARPGCEIA